MIASPRRSRSVRDRERVAVRLLGLVDPSLELQDQAAVAERRALAPTILELTRAGKRLVQQGQALFEAPHERVGQAEAILPTALGGSVAGLDRRGKRLLRRGDGLVHVAEVPVQTTEVADILRIRCLVAGRAGRLDGTFVVLEGVVVETQHL